jgi:O-antigen ligase
MLAWLLGMATLILAQSKTAWISFAVCAVAMYLTLHGHDLYKKLTDPLYPQRGIALILVLTIATLIVSISALFGDAGNKLSHFLNSESGAQLTSLTGRDIIWAAALDEWARNPIFGYGQSFLDQAYRISIGILNATHGHNQYMDLLARAGLVGAIPLTIYLIILMAGSIRHAKASRGITLVIFIAIALRAVSEVPLTLTGYGSEFIAQLLLLILLPAYNSLSQAKQTQAKTAEPRALGSYTPVMHP